MLYAKALGGDEMGRTQQGNNNAYCQDNEITWFDWDHADTALKDFTGGAAMPQSSSPR
jgi:pullulanase/glycogen debranching enzyme